MYKTLSGWYMCQNCLQLFGPRGEIQESEILFLKNCENQRTWDSVELFLALGAVPPPSFSEGPCFSVKVHKGQKKHTWIKGLG